MSIVHSVSIVLRRSRVHNFLFLHRSGCTRRKLLADGCLRKRLVNAWIGVGVCEFIELLEFQAPIVIGNDVRDVYRLAFCVQSDWVFRLRGRL